MAPKKRARAKVPSATPPNKRQKLSQQQPQHVLAAAATAPSAASPQDAPFVDITALNAVQSPLLRLPAELRNKIWSYAYGDEFVHVDQGFSKHRLFRFHVCQHKGSSRPCGCSRNTPLFSIPLVSKQFWWEVSASFQSSATLVFNTEDSYNVLRAFLRSAHAFLAQVRYLELLVLSEHWMYRGDLRGYALTSALVGTMKNLQGIRLSLDFDFGPMYLLSDPDIMRSADWKGSGIPRIIQSFRQHKLNPDKIAVDVRLSMCPWRSVLHLNGNFKPSASDLVSFEEAIKNALLDHHPRRLSKRMRGTEE
ncbi:hypothetical protein EKO04_009235 [Ascochyta lentis]|uniref:DUF7730 domain-containing protein n=1 Tax=Ascochyta lentis TaxID=205686 RepID=A0A8H7IXQ2_9PLEO|nr:hypothetical protein EKO04_009235 [Ascochyta lentis]